MKPDCPHHHGVADRPRRARWFAALFIVALAVHGAGAADLTWTNTGGGNFGDSGNWDAGVPGAADQALFNISATYQVAWTAGATNSKAYFGSTAGTGTVTLAIDGNAWILTNGMQLGSAAGSVATVWMTNGAMWVTNFFATNCLGEAYGTAILKLGDGRGSFVLAGGTATVNQLNLGIVSSSNSVLITGTNTLLNIGRPYQNAILIGQNDGSANGYNTITITNGARVIANGSGAKVTPDNLWSIPIYGQQQKIMVAGSNTFLSVTNNNIVLYGHDNEMRISGGAECQLPYGISFPASQSGGRICSNNVVRVTGSGPVMKTGTGTANLMGTNNRFIVENGAQCMASTFLSVAGGSNSFWLIDGTGTVFTAANDIYAYSDAETPCVIVTNGAKLVCGVSGYYARLANTAGKKGIMVVTGNGTIWTNNVANAVLNVGVAANTFGSLTISDGATVYSSTAYIPQSATSTGIVYVTGSGSLWTNSGNVTVPLGSGSSGTLKVGDGGVAAMNNLTATSTGTLAIVASPISAGTINVGTLTVDATSKLNVDLTNCAAGNAVYTLVNYTSMPVKFAESNITVNTRPNFLVHSKYVLDQSTGNKITLTITLPAGTVFTVF
ncbi:MAG: hypothetical protein L6437_01210 [Kiritimatiellae bacterium]|nr:hypothetical protein [Kiritimatiellia bacterium]